jgi:hypothetical protein
MFILSAIFGFFTKNPLGQKLGIVILCCTAFFIYLNWHDEKIAREWEAKGLKIGAEETRKSMEAEWAEREKKNAVERKGIDEARAQQLKEKAELVRLRSSLEASLTSIQAASHAQMEAANAFIGSIPDAELIANIRAQSARLGIPLDERPTK